MAQNMTPEEIQAEFEAYAQALKNGTANTKEWAERMKDAEAGVKNYTATLNASLKGLGTSMLGTMSALKDGTTGFGVYNNALEKGADAVSDFASKFGIIGAVIGAVVKAATAYVVAVNKQADKLYQGYQNISKIGATGADGMTGVFQSMQKFGYGVDDLNKMTDLLKENSSTLSTFGGTMVEGTKRFASLAGELQHSSFGRDMREMGIGIDEVNKSAAGYIKTQVMIGKNSATMDRDLAANTASYIKELNALSKITGQTREQQEAAIEASQKEEAMNQVLFELDQRAASGDEQAARQAKKLRDLQLLDIPEGLKKELAKGIGGDVAAQQKLQLIAPNLIKDAMDENKSLAETMNSYGGDMKRALGPGGLAGLGKLNAFNETFGDLAEYRKSMGKWNGENADQILATAKAAQTVTDPLAKTAAANEINQNNARDAMQSMLQQGIIPVTKGMEGLSSVINKVTTGAAGAVGAAPAGGAPPMGGGGGGAGGGEGGSSAAPVMPATKTKKVWIGSELVVEGSPEHKAAMAAQQAPSPGGAKPGATANAGPATPATGTPVSPDRAITGKGLDGVSEGLAKAVKSAATEYMAVTGKPVNVTSAYRSPEEQQKLYENSLNGKSPYPAAPPGKSKHGQGNAVDIDSSIANAMDQQGLLAKYGLARPVPNDPVHLELAKGYAEGGVATGPTSGYQANLQGTNAVVPLPSGQQIPVDMPEFNTNLSDQTAILSQQLSKLDDLVRVMQSQVAVSTKIMQNAG